MIGACPIYLGIDPGVNGGIAALYGEQAVRFTTMPDTEIGVLDWLAPYSQWPVAVSAIPTSAGSPINPTHGSTVLACIEEIPAAMPFSGKASMSKIYGGYRALRMACAALGISFFTEKAAGWHRALGIPPRNKSEKTTVWKNRLKQWADKLFPSLRSTLSTSDALLIAYYCRMKGNK